MEDYQTINIVGVGKVGLALAQALKQVGYTVLCLVDKQENRLDRARSLELAHSYTTSLCELPAADIVFLCVNDDQIGFAMNDLIANFKTNKIADFVFHCSGALSAAELNALRKYNIKIGTLHPVQTLSGSIKDYEKLFGIYFALEGDEEAVSAAKVIVKKLKGKTIVLSEIDKPIHHLACTFAANYVNFLISLVIEIYRRIGIEENQALELIQPLVRASIENTFEKGTENSITGPASRGDVGTIEKHLDILKENFPEFENIYKLLGKRIFDYSSILKNLDEKTIQQMHELFEL